MGKVIRITDEQINKLIEMYLEGYKKVDIAKFLCISTQSVTKYLNKNNIKQKEHFLSDELKKTICELYLCNRLSIATITKNLNVDRMSVIRALNNAGIEKRTMSEEFRDYSLDQHYFDNIDTPNKAYILGLLYADGNVTSNRYAIQLCLQEDDKHILDKIKEELSTNLPLYFKNGKNCKNTYSLIVNNKHMHQELIKYGVVPRKTFIIKFPDFLDKNLYSHFIRGYFDGDGSFCYGKRKDRKNSYYSSFTIIGTEMLCSSIKNILESELNVRCHIKQAKGDSTYPIKELRVSGRIQCQDILNWIYKDSDMFLIRKKNKYLEFNNLYDLAC